MDKRALNQWFDADQILKLYKTTLINNNINGEVLQKMNISLYGHRLEMLRQITQLKSASNTNRKATIAFSYIIAEQLARNNSNGNAFNSNNNMNIASLSIRKHSFSFQQ
eukprot:216206_1